MPDFRDDVDIDILSEELRSSCTTRPNNPKDEFILASTVAIMPVAEAVDVEINNSDLQLTPSSRGAGG